MEARLIPRRRVMNVDLTVGEALTFRSSVDNQEITLTIEAKSGRHARLRVQAPESTQVIPPGKKRG
jgi:hypothetical protein